MKWKETLKVDYKESLQKETRGEYFRRIMKEKDIRYKDIKDKYKIRPNYVQVLNNDGITLRKLAEFAEAIDISIVELVEHKAEL